MTAFWLFVYKIARAHLHAKRGPHMVCCECGLLIHRHDRFRVVDVVHINCKDVKLVKAGWADEFGGRPIRAQQRGAPSEQTALGSTH